MKLRLMAAMLPLLFAAPAVADDPVPSAKDYPAPPAGWKVARTAWGDPDLRGMWPVDYLAATPRERPPEIGNRTEWTEAEYKARFGEAEQRAGLEAAQDKVGILGMGHWREDGFPLWQTSMVTEPANGRYPALTEQGRRAKAAVHDSWNTEVFDSLSDFGNWDRCLTRGLPASLLPGAYNMGIRVMQSPGLVVIAIEMVHETRFIYLDGRDPPPADVTQYLGYSRGHWDGDTLVIETTNFTPGMSNGVTPNSAQMKLTERITPTGPNQMRYEAWVEDPVMLTAPYKIDMPWKRNSNYEFFEYACHEGNVQVRGYITSTSPRFAKLREEQWAKQGEKPSDEEAGPGGAP
ncbi:MAG: hypothetical protein J0I69_07695 [Altererythrobacter sp.]|nr:hypothetical protein [Altererythrobacter sp.]